jgi:hypothetical protein
MATLRCLISGGVVITLPGNFGWRGFETCTRCACAALAIVLCLQFSLPTDVDPSTCG